MFLPSLKPISKKVGVSPQRAPLPTHGPLLQIARFAIDKEIHIKVRVQYVPEILIRFKLGSISHFDKFQICSLVFPRQNRLLIYTINSANSKLTRLPVVYRIFFFFFNLQQVRTSGTCCVYVVRVPPCMQPMRVKLRSLVVGQRTTEGPVGCCFLCYLVESSQNKCATIELLQNLMIFLIRSLIN